MTAPAHVEKAASLAFIQQLIEIGEMFSRIGVQLRTCEVKLPIVASAWVPAKAAQGGYRKCPVPAGAKFEADKVTLGKKNGLIFHFKPLVAAQSGDVYDRIELPWDETQDIFPDIADKVEAELGFDVEAVNQKLKAACAKRKEIHKILSEGFDKAFSARNDRIRKEAEHSEPLFGIM